MPASTMEGNTSGKLNDNVNDGVTPEKPNDVEEAGLLVQAESNLSEDNRVPRKTRAPRYFDPLGKWQEWNICYENNNERKKRKRRKTCYICGDHRHKGRQCKQAMNCVLCDKIGHLAMQCPNKDAGEDSEYELCLKCGNSDHTMFTCTNDYDPEDLKGLQCYICKEFGHLGCNNHKTEVPSKATCYNCGEFGHLGQDCSKSIGQNIKEILSRRNESTIKKKKRKRGGGKKKKAKQPPIFVDALNTPSTWPRPLSPQAAASRNFHPDFNPVTASQHQPINYSVGTHQINNPSLPVHQLPQFSINHGNQVAVRVHGHEAQIPVNSYTLPHLSNVSWNSQNVHQPQPQVKFLVLNQYGAPHTRPPLSHQNAVLLPVPRTYIAQPPLNYQTVAHCPHQIINHQPIAMLPHPAVNRPVFPNQIRNSGAGNTGLG